MKFSVIMPSLMQDYPGAANNRVTRFLKAVESVLAQTYQDFELIIVADGCELTRHTIHKFYRDNPKVRTDIVKRTLLFSNEPRNRGIAMAEGDYILYIDTDDLWGKDHLQIINQAIINQDWVYFNDWIWQDEKWKVRPMDINQYGKCGTSNICHASRLGLRWIETGYGHDYHFIQQLLKFGNHEDIGPAQYYVARMTDNYHDQMPDNKL